MKRLVLFGCMLSAILLPAQSRETKDASAQYFPANVFLDAAQAGFRDKWYSSTLRALLEPSFFATKSDSSQQVYRFLWLPSFHRPISVRVTVNVDGGGSIVTRSVDSHAGLLTKPASDTGKLTLDAAIAVNKAQVQEMLEQLQRLDFWSLSAELGVDQLGEDGSHWILEGVRAGEYHVVDRWSPTDGPFSELCKYLLRLGRVETSLY